MLLISELRRERQLDLCEFETSGVHIEFWASLVDIAKACLKTDQNKTK